MKTSVKFDYSATEADKETARRLKHYLHLKGSIKLTDGEKAKMKFLRTLDFRSIHNGAAYQITFKIVISNTELDAATNGGDLRKLIQQKLLGMFGE